jgi:chromosome segregation ATPase
LAKKLRELTSTFEAEKTKNKQLLKNCKELEKLLEKYKEKEIKNDQNSEIEEDGQDSDLEKGSTEKKISPSKQIKELKEKLNQITHKMMEYRSQTEILKQDLKKTQKVSQNLNI